MGRFTAAAYKSGAGDRDRAFASCARAATGAAVVVLSRLDPWMYPSAHSALVAQVLFTIVILGVFRLSVAW